MSKLNATDPLGLLLLCARPRITPAVQEQIRQQVQQPLDWPELLRTARGHSVLPLLYRQLKSVGLDQAPAPAWPEIEAAVQANARWSLALTGELLKALARFKREGITALAFKGPVLATQLYGDLALRQFVDVDILVPARQATAAWHHLTAQGYQPQFQLRPAQQQRFVERRQELMFHHPEKQTNIELHWAVHPAGFSFSPPPDLAWQRPERVRIGGQQVETLAREHLLLFLGLHGAKHNWRCLGWIADVAALLETSPALDWDYLQTHAGQFGTRRMWRLGLRLAHELCEGPLPPALAAEIEADLESARLARTIRQQFFPPPCRSRNPLVNDRVYRATMERARDRRRYWIDTVFTPTPLEWALLPLPGWLAPLYYPLRLLRLAIKNTFRP